MLEKLELNEFDLLGMITLEDVGNIQELVTPICENGASIRYLSRSKEYYNVKSMNELSELREKLKGMITQNPSKKNFVMLEYMLNCSGKVYFKKFQEYIKSGKDIQYKGEFEQSQRCLMEDTMNMISILEGRNIDIHLMKSILPGGTENCERRFIEMDNKTMLYFFSKAIQELRLGNNFDVLTPGYGSVYIGPFLRTICGYDFTNMLKSKYIDETNTLGTFNFSSLLDSDSILRSDRGVLLLDDNVGTGSTMTEVNNMLRNEGKNNVLSGAVQFNWRNYYRVSIGEKMDIERFNPNDYAILTPINYAGHKLYKQAVDALNSGGQDYIEYLQTKGYRSEKYNDIVGAVLRGFTWSEKTNLVLLDKMRGEGEKPRYEVLAKYNDGPHEILNPIAKKMIETIYKYSSTLDKDIDQKFYLGKI